jgi:hypothetical protein
MTWTPACCPSPCCSPTCPSPPMLAGTGGDPAPLPPPLLPATADLLPALDASHLSCAGLRGARYNMSGVMCNNEGDCVMCVACVDFRECVKCLKGVCQVPSSAWGDCVHSTCGAQGDCLSCAVLRGTRLSQAVLKRTVYLVQRLGGLGVSCGAQGDWVSHAVRRGTGCLMRCSGGLYPIGDALGDRLSGAMLPWGTVCLMQCSGGPCVWCVAHGEL